MVRFFRMIANKMTGKNRSNLFTLLIVAALSLLLLAGCNDDEAAKDKEENGNGEQINGEQEMDRDEIDLTRRENPQFISEDEIVYAGLRTEHEGVEDAQEMWEIFYIDLTTDTSETLYADMWSGALPLMDYSGDYLFIPSGERELEIVDQDLETIDVLMANWARHYPGDDYIYFRPALVDPGEDQIDSYHIESGDIETVYESEGLLELEMVEAGSGVIFEEYNGNNYIRQLDLENPDQVQDIVAIDGMVLDIAAGYVPELDEEMVFVVLETQTGAQLTMYDLDGVERESKELEGFQPSLELSPTGEYLLAIVEDKGGATAELVDISEFSVIDDLEMNNASWAPEGNRLVYETPLRDVEMYNLDAQSIMDVPYPSE